MAKNLKVGDRVKIYGGSLCGMGSRHLEIGEVIGFGRDFVRIQFTSRGFVYSFHPKQLRRLVKREKPKAREWWVNLYRSTSFNYKYFVNYENEAEAKSSSSALETIHVREVINPRSSK